MMRKLAQVLNLVSLFVSANGLLGWSLFDSPIVYNGPEQIHISYTGKSLQRYPKVNLVSIIKRLKQLEQNLK